MGPAIERGLAAALALFAWLNSGPRHSGTPVLVFNAREYRPGETAEVPPFHVGTLTREQTETACPRQGEVQDLTSEIADRVRREGNYWTPQGYGTAVHTQLARAINGPLGWEFPHDPNFRAEYSVRKSLEEG